MPHSPPPATGSQRGRLRIEAERGLVDCIRAGGELDGFALPTALPNLFLLPRGKSGSVSGEIFLTPGFETLMTHARASYDYVVIDSIPVFAN